MTVEVDLLGPVEVVVGGRRVSAGSPMQRAVLAVLATRSPDVVQRDELIELIWGDGAPQSAAGNVQTYVAALRRIMEPERSRQEQPQVLLTVGSGYQLRLAPGATDVQRFTERAAAGYGLLAGGDDDGAATEFESALAVWRGEALIDVPGPFAQAKRISYAESKLNVLEVSAGVMLALGRAKEVVGPLLEALAEDSLRERIAVYAIEALADCGRADEALDLCDRVEWTLANELGVQPGPEFAVLRARILGHEPVSARKTAIAGSPAPAQMPHAVRQFGRARELTKLRELVRSNDGSPRLVVLHGAGGVGKSGLAVHLGLEVSGLFPDGQLYVNLRGFGPGNDPLSVDDAIGALLYGLGVESDQIPSRSDERIGYLRTLLSDKRVLIVLDNAANAAQVRPLIPGSDDCFTIVTSRNRLRDLAVIDGAAALQIGVLTEPDAIELLGGIIGAKRVDAEPEAARELVRLCGLLPLSLRIAAERAAMRPRQALAELVDELDVVEQRLDLLSMDDDAATTRAVFSWSYAALSPSAARLFRLLGTFPGPDFSISAVAALAGLMLPEVERDVHALANAHLLEVYVSNRYRLHDLVKLYALERFDAEDSAPRRDAASRRLLDWYLHGAVAADRWLSPEGRSSDEVEPPDRSVTPPAFSSHQSAADWCEVELANIVKAVQMAAACGFRGHAWRIPNFLMGFLILRSRYSEWIETLSIAVDQCRLLGDAKSEARSRFNLLLVYTQIGRHTDVLEQCAALLATDVDRAEPRLRPYVLNAMGYSLLALRRPAEAAERLENALAGEHGAVAAKLSGVLANLGEAYTSLDRYDEALERHQQALSMRQELGDTAAQSTSWKGIGELHLRSGNYHDAANCFVHARELSREAGAPRAEATALRNLGRTYMLIGRYVDAGTEFERALTIFEELGDAVADEVRRELLRLPESKQ